MFDGCLFPLIGFSPIWCVIKNGDHASINTKVLSAPSMEPCAFNLFLSLWLSYKILIDFKINSNHVLFIFLGRATPIAILNFGHANFSTIFNYNVCTCSILMFSNRAIDQMDEGKNCNKKKNEKSSMNLYQLERNKAKIKMRSLIFGSS